MQKLFQFFSFFLIACLYVGCADVRKVTLENIAYQADSASILLFHPDNDLEINELGMAINNKEEWNQWSEFPTNESYSFQKDSLQYNAEMILWRKGEELFKYQIALSDSVQIMRYITIDSIYHHQISTKGSEYLADKFDEISENKVPIHIFKKLNWLCGKWEGESGKDVFGEIWQKVSETKYTGKGCTLNGDDTTFVEKLSLELINDTIYYLPDVEHNEGVVPFKLTQVEEGWAKFENPKHDFPNRIIYHLISQETLHVRVEGDTEDGVNGFDLELIKRD